MKTQEQLQKMTDQELTFELARLVYFANKVYVTHFDKVGVIVDDIFATDECLGINDWDFIMPLAVENDVTYNITYCLAGSGQVFTAMSIDKEETHSGYCESPQRAIAICLILKLQEIQA